MLGHLEPEAGVDLAFHAGDLLAGVPPEGRFSLVYENLPNIPAAPGVELELGVLSGRFFDAPTDDVPPLFANALLAFHHRCLLQARSRLLAGGGVLTAIGGRIPRQLAFDLHRFCGYCPELVAFDVKVQVEPDLVLPGYHQAEDDTGVEFTFYAAEAIEIVAAARRANLDGQELADSVDDELRRLAISTREAEARCRRGQPVAHSVLLVFGTRTRASPAAPQARPGSREDDERTSAV